MTTSIASQLELLQLEIAKSREKHPNFKDNVRLVAVSKRQPLDKIEEAYQAGHRDFGENFVQEGVEKIQNLNKSDVQWHMLGAIQSRKCKDIAEYFDWVQSVDRIKVINKLNRAREGKPPLNVCIQVNLFGEEQKAGVVGEAIFELANRVEEAQNLKLRGIMALPPKQTEYARQVQQFEKIAELYQQLTAKYPHIDTLSMGMSGDFEAAIAAGSNMIRIGTAIFGQRDA
ncbi:YggS family pyridoxal phosphate-dependent enzyme [Kangiella sediminilitoris]|uniref:Pyridoxal phosphate homeostasis protein n=1 Tax=Kangiella sediminilitoris TaxID=1144748 RepID=A0A1B3BDL2_9GAMM|nr:YggS family pyridoxal phosphate-dependent enzyme [Kangiella sediminilitoris]AOE50880.1 Alanine racemase domain protein [Kangiella sediminilitoris]